MDLTPPLAHRFSIEHSTNVRPKFERNEFETKRGDLDATDVAAAIDHLGHGEARSFTIDRCARE